jgi:hypothetical protein
MSFITGTVVEQLYSLPASVTKNSWTSIAAYTGVAGTNPVCSIPAGLFLNMNPNPVGRGLYLEAHGTIQNTAAATFANAININPALATSTNNITINTAYTPTASVTAPWRILASITCTAFTTSAMTLQVNGECRYHAVASGGAPSTGVQDVGFTGTWTALDPRVTQYVELFGTWSASNASNQTVVQQLKLFGVN